MKYRCMGCERVHGHLAGCPVVNLHDKIDRLLELGYTTNQLNELLGKLKTADCGMEKQSVVS
jgi:hypothetical protein